MIPFLGYGKEPMIVAPAGCIAGSNLLPDNCAHVIKANRFAELDYFFSDWNYLVSAVINRPCKLVADVYAQTTAIGAELL